MTIAGSEKPIYKLENSVFSFGVIETNYNMLLNIISLLSLELKFVPSFFNNTYDYFQYLLNDIDNSLTDFNARLFFEKKK